MANDRVMIRCTSCGGWKMLLKHFPGIGLETRENNIISWIDSHGKCHPNINDTDLGGNPGFSLHTEDSTVLDPELQNYRPQ